MIQIIAFETKDIGVSHVAAEGYIWTHQLLFDP